MAMHLSCDGIGHTRDRRLSGFAAEKRPLEFHCPTPALQYLKDCLLESGEVIRNHELDTRQAALFQSQKEFLPTALALAFFWPSQRPGPAADLPS